jgi:hypothetical protein
LAIKIGKDTEEWLEENGFVRKALRNTFREKGPVREIRNQRPKERASKR